MESTDPFVAQGRPHSPVILREPC